MKNKINRLFLNVGAMKAGTTWLYSLLKEHPDIYFTPEKEIHFWSDYVNNTNYLSKEKRLEKSKQLLKHAELEMNIDKYRLLLRWNHNYTQNAINLDWYKRLFILNTNDNVYNADFSNLTCQISDQGWESVKAMTNELKVVYILRNPTERLWSHVKFHHQFSGQFVDFDRWSVEDFEKFIKLPFMWVNCEYAKWIKIMQENLEEDQFKILYFEDFRKQPKEELLKLESFLGVEHSNFPNHKLTKKVNPSKNIPKPVNFEKATQPLIALELEKLEKLAIDTTKFIL